MCTAISILSKQRETFFGRTMDFYHELDLEVLSIPKGYLIKSCVSSYTCYSKYAFIGAGQFINEVSLADGLNEEGLGVAALYFPGYADFNTEIKENKNSITNIEVVTYLLSNCKNIKEVKELMASTHIIGAKDDITNSISPLHWIVTDKTGDSLTIEQTRNGLQVLSNPIGILSNSPDFAWHYTNLRNYMNITSIASKTKEWRNIRLTPFGEGTGSIGLPGDFTSPTRFIRLAFAKSFAEIPETREEMLTLCFHLMNLVSIPKGLVITSSPNKEIDYTQYKVIMNLNTGEYYFNTYTNCHIKKANIKDNKTGKVISLGKLNSKAIIKHM